MSDSFDDRLSKASEEVSDLEQQFDKFNRDNTLRLTIGTLPPNGYSEIGKAKKLASPESK